MVAELARIRARVFTLAPNSGQFDCRKNETVGLVLRSAYLCVVKFRTTEFTRGLNPRGESRSKREGKPVYRNDKPVGTVVGKRAARSRAGR